MNNNKNEFELNGKRYVAVSHKGCYGCAFFDDPDDCRHALPCSSTNRSDGREVIWVEAPKKEEGETRWTTKTNLN